MDMCRWGPFHFFLTGTPERFSEGFNSRREVSLKGVTQNFNFWRVKTSRINRVRVGGPQQHALTLPLPYLPISDSPPPPRPLACQYTHLSEFRENFGRASSVWEGHFCGVDNSATKIFPKRACSVGCSYGKIGWGFLLRPSNPDPVHFSLRHPSCLLLHHQNFPWTHTSEPPPKLLHPRHDFSYTLFSLLRATIILIYYLHYYV